MFERVPDPMPFGTVHVSSESETKREPSHSNPPIVTEAIGYVAAAYPREYNDPKNCPWIVTECPP
eukprot:1466619-Rhodomonas_salina.4